jgi:D-glycero-D-manno-heptose 1,7-bisphosphate phosphatase
MKRAVFLDRDGVINKSLVVNGIPTPPRSLDQLEILPGVIEGLEILRKCEFELVVVTNQPDVQRGKMLKPIVEAIHMKLKVELRIHHFYTCFHDDANNCLCRKPKPGLLKQAADELNLDLESSFLVGDRWRDILAGQSVGCRCFFIDNLLDERQPVAPFTRVSSLLEAAQQIIKESEVEISR